MSQAEARAKKSVDQIAKVGQALLGMGAALTALTAVMVKEAAEDQKLQQRLSILFGSAEAGAKAFETLEKRARETGTSTNTLTDAVQALNIYFSDSPELIMKLLPRFQDLAAYMGTDIPTAVAAFGRAMTGGASDTITMRGPMLALVKDFAQTKLGISDLTKMELPAFRKMLLDFIQSPESKFGDFAAKSAKTFSGQLAVLRESVGQLAAKLGESLLPALTVNVAQIVKVIEWLRNLPPELQAVIAWVTSTVGVFATLAGGLMALLPRILSTVVALKSMGTVALATGATITGVVAIIGAAAAATYLWTTRINQAYDAANKTARSQNDLANVVHGLTKGTKEWYEAEAARLESVAYGNKKILDQAATYRELAAAMKDAAGGRREFNELAYSYYEAEQAMLNRIKEGALNFARGIVPEKPEGEKWLPESSEKHIEPLKKTIDWLGALGQAAGAAGQSMGQMFGDMAAGAEVDVGKVILQIVKLIAKLLIMAALYAIPGVGPILSQFAGGFLGAVGFDNPVSDTKAWRWGADFVRQFDQGMSSMLSGGLSLPQMQPAAIGGMGGLAFDIHVHEPGPDTYVKVVRRGVAAMSDNEAFGLYRNKLGRASDRWDGR